jgi:hypothetical protein
MGVTTNAVNKSIPGIKNFRGTDFLLKYVKLRRIIAMAKNPAMAYCF